MAKLTKKIENMLKSAREIQYYLNVYEWYDNPHFIRNPHGVWLLVNGYPD